MRLRIGGWPGGARGTVLALPGRAEWIEKYGRVAAALKERGYGLLAIDWRGQGLSARAVPDPRMGHVGHFDEYQTDLAAFLDAAQDLGVARPAPVLAHSMGGCIALRALMDGLDAPAVALSAPMWGLHMSPALRSAAWSVATLARATGRAARYPPGVGPELNVAETPFDDNMLTSDPESYDYMRRMLLAQPELVVGGPSLNWLYAALREMRALAPRPSPETPAHIVFGTRERIVDAAAIRRRAAAWPAAAVDVIDGAEHEVLMETPAIRARAIAAAADLFDAQCP